jgi:hypothetical protein
VEVDENAVNGTENQPGRNNAAIIYAMDFDAHTSSSLMEIVPPT